MEEETTFVNIKMPSELLEKLDEMVQDEESDRSKFIRKLIRQEYARRAQLPLFPPDQPKRKTNPKMRAVSMAA